MSISFTEEQVFNQEVIDCDWYELCVRLYEDGIMKDEVKLGDYIYEEEVVKDLNDEYVLDFDRLNYGDEVIVFVCKENDCNRERIFEWIKGEELNELIGEIPEEEEEVRCICLKCFGEGKCYVSKERARELEKLELRESECPYGDKCEFEYDNLTLSDIETEEMLFSARLGLD